MLELSTTLNLIETAGILIGITLGIMEIRNIRQDRRNQFAVEMLEYHISQEYTEHWLSFMKMKYSTPEEWREKYGPVANPEEAVHWYIIANTFDQIGHRLLNGQIDFDTVLSYLNPVSVEYAWEKCNSIFEEWRELYNLPSIMAGFEFLVKEIKRKYPEMNPMRLPEQ
jgi:hypothetical protein